MKRAKIKAKLVEWLAHCRLIGMLYKEFKLLTKRRKAPLLVISLPILLLLIYSIGSSVLSNPQAVIKAGYCNLDSNAGGIIQNLNTDLELIDLSGPDCLLELKNQVLNGDLIIGFVIPSDFTSRINNADPVIINYYVDDSKPLSASMSSYLLEQGFNDYSQQVVTGVEDELKSIVRDADEDLTNTLVLLNTTNNVLESNKALFGITYSVLSDYMGNAINSLADYKTQMGFLEQLSVEFLTKPIRFNHQTLYAKVNRSSFNFAGVYTIISLFTLLLLASNGLILDKKTQYLTRIKATKTFIPNYLLSKIIFYVCLSFAQLLIVMALMLLQGAVFNMNFLTLFYSFILVTIMNTSLGLIIGALSDSENVAILLSLTISLPFLFLSGIFFPTEFMPDYIQLIINALPLSNEVTILKQASVLGATVASVQPLMNNLLITSLVLLTTTFIVLKRKPV